MPDTFTLASKLRAASNLAKGTYIAMASKLLGLSSRSMQNGWGVMVSHRSGETEDALRLLRAVSACFALVWVEGAVGSTGWVFWCSRFGTERYVEKG